MYNGDIDEGVELLRQVLSEVGLLWPRGPRRALLSLVAARARVRLRGLHWTERAEADQPPAALRQLDTAWSAAMSLASSIVRAAPSSRRAGYSWRSRG